MSSTVEAFFRAEYSLSAALTRTFQWAAPSWPLDRQIAVNPFRGLAHEPFETVAAELARLSGSRLTLGLDEYRRRWQSGDITADALSDALAEEGRGRTLSEALAALEHGADTMLPPAFPLPSDLLDEQTLPSDGPRWNDTLTQQVSQYCAAYFDERQADWHPDHRSGLFAGWRAGLLTDHALEPLMQVGGLRQRAGNIPADPEEALRWSLGQLDVRPEHTERFLKVCLLRITGWASWCAYRAFQAELRGASDHHLGELLAIRVCFEALLVGIPVDGAIALDVWRQRWSAALAAQEDSTLSLALVWQRAHELAYQQLLLERLSAVDVPAVTAADRPRANLVFCIDVRSERFRRHLEHAEPAIVTHGYAGFFGLPIAYQPLGAADFQPQCPGLLLPTLSVTDSSGDASEDRRLAARMTERTWVRAVSDRAERTPTGAFAAVETTGLAAIGSLLRQAFGLTAQRAAPADTGLRPQLMNHQAGAPLAVIDRVHSALTGMQLTQSFGRLIVIVGHAAQSTNNPQAAALHCGACSGHAGDINARLLASLLNEPAVRAGLQVRGIAIPDDSIALAGLHNTTTDEVTLYDLSAVPATHAAEVSALQQKLVHAGHETRRERAAALRLSPDGRPQDLLQQYRRRARDWAETRPEWGLANNAGFLIAPRRLTRGMDLDGRCFLHDYEPTADPDGAQLEAILTAPVVVAHWINLQYYASTVAPNQYGSGNKVLHNVVGQGIGLFEGNSGDLRIGLSWQSVHDGKHYRHDPLRLTVVVNAPRERITAVLQRQKLVRQLVENRWIHLYGWTADGIEPYRCRVARLRAH